MTIEEAVERALEQPTLVKGLTYMALWETSRIVKQVTTNLVTGQRGSDGKLYDTMFEHAFTLYLQRWNERHK